MSRVHVLITPVLQRVDTGERKETYCWHCRRRTTRALIATYWDSPYFEPSGEWRCLECRRDTQFGVSPLDCRPLDAWDPPGTPFRVPDHWFEEATR